MLKLKASAEMKLYMALKIDKESMKCDTKIWNN